MADVVVSYSRSDKARVAPLVAALEAEGWSVWWDPAVAPGQQFDRMIAGELERAHAVLVGRPATSAAIAPALNPAASSGPPRIAICVLPLDNLGGDPEQQNLSDGITADIITELSRRRLLAVSLGSRNR